MRCAQCTERNSVAARKCEFCGEKFKRKPVPLALKLGIAGVAVAVTASIAASYVLPKFVDPEQNLGRVAKRLAAGPSSVDDAQKIKKEFATAVKSYLKDNGTAKTPELTAGLEKLLPSSAYEVHIAELPRGLRVVEIDTVLQASDFLVMKTSSGLKVFDLPGFEVFDDARILNDSAGPVLALIGHSGGPPPHKPLVRTYALLPDYVSDESEKLVPAMKGDGQARFASNNRDIQVELVKSQSKTAMSSHEDVSYGMLHWKDAKYTADFTTQEAKYVAKHFNDALVTAKTAAPAATPSAPPPVVSSATVANKQSIDIKANSTVKEVVSAAVPSLKRALSRGSDQNAKIVVRGLTDKQAVSANELIGKMPPAAPASSGAAMAAVPLAPPVASAVVRTVTAPLPGNGVESTKQKTQRPQTNAASGKPASTKQTAAAPSNHSFATVTCNGATVRSAPGRGAKAIDGMSHGQQVEIIGHDGDWFKIRYSGGREGYVFSSLVSGAGGTPAPAVSSEPATAAGSTSGNHKGSRHHHHRDSVLVADATQHVARTEERHSRTDSSSTDHHSSKHKSRKHSQASAPVVEAPTLVP